MKSLFNNNQIIGFAIFTDKKNWECLLPNLLNIHRFFFFFSAERGNHLNLFLISPSSQDILQVEEFLKNSLNGYSIYENSNEDILFIDSVPNSFLPVHYIEKTQDILYNDTIEDEYMVNFLFDFNNILVDSLKYNDYFIHEENRLNFALQLMFLALIRADLATIMSELESWKNKDKSIKKTFFNIQKALVVFFEDIYKIEATTDIEQWVIYWLKLSNTFLKKGNIFLLADIICRIMNIESKKNTLIYLIKETLKSSQIKV